MFGHLFDPKHQDSAVDFAIERAIDAVEPYIRLSHGYRERYRHAVATALEYAHSLANSVPGPVSVDRSSYASDAFVHALFPSADSVADALNASRALRDYYQKSPGTDALYALMGMRRLEKNTTGMEIRGDLIQRDVMQKTVYFTGHTIENPAPTEQQSRELVAISFFDCLVGKVRQRIASRRQEMQSRYQKKIQLMQNRRDADEKTHSSLQAELAGLLSDWQSTGSGNLLEDFEAVLLHPEQHLRIRQTRIEMDDMGIRHADAHANPHAVLFNELIDFDRRDWTVTMVYCSNIQAETFSSRLTDAYRRLAL